NSRRFSAARSSTPSRPASRDLPARNGLTGMTAQQSITLFHRFQRQLECQVYGIVRQTALVVECPHYGVAHLDTAAERFDGGRESAVDVVDHPAVDQRSVVPRHAERGWLGPELSYHLGERSFHRLAADDGRHRDDRPPG